MRMNPMAVAPKPRIKKKHSWWVCWSYNHSGSGDTPRQAYAEWRRKINNDRDHFGYVYVTSDNKSGRGNAGYGTYNPALRCCISNKPEGYP